MLILNALRRAIACVALGLLCLSATCQDMIDLSKTPVLCNQIKVFKLKEVLPDGYAYYCDDDNTEIVLTRDKAHTNRYTSKFPKSPYMASCDYEVKQLGKTVTMFAYLMQYQEDSPYYVLFAADSPEHYCKQWEERLKGGQGDCDWIFSVPIDEYFIGNIDDVEQLQQMRSRLEQSGRTDDLIKFNIRELAKAIEAYDADDCEAE